MSISDYAESKFLIAVHSSDLKHAIAMLSIGKDGAATAELLHVRAVFVGPATAVEPIEQLKACKTVGGWEEVLAQAGFERLDS